MIISPGRRFVFVHVPKTGGTSLTLALEARAMKDDILIGDTPKAQRRRKRLKGLQARGRLWKHATLADIEGVLPQETLEAMQVVTLVRNPWDRMVSYYHWLRDQTFDHPATALAKTLNFADFLRHDHTQRSFSAEHFGHYVTGSDGAERPALFIRLEHLAQDLRPFEAHLGFSFDMPHYNSSRRPGGYRALYDSDTRDLLGRMCARDIARFGYRF
ncbi:sulfotransferase family 2 domain-containing protein [Oceaniglobus ichthyenteri]|uniref:sulfotransferase family 2 domain-containing protein n=1 Tax=Oceaniglobus ichthyenteri TaxID=2136177 RepID=UPI000D3C5BB4|nr:sulfotransferase family 2 domain-containing protein [Oceaniglobus ichthyenteri]